MKMRSLALFLLVVVLGLALASCGSSSGGSNPTSISVGLSPSTAQTIFAGQKIPFTATVTNDSSNAGVTFSVSSSACSGSGCGTFINVGGFAATYLAPATVSANLIVTVTAKSVADSSKSASTSVTVQPNTSNITVAFSPDTPQTIDAGQTFAFPFIATVTNDTSNQGVTFTATGSGCSGNSCGRFSNVSALQATYSAPASVTSNLAVTVTATSVANTSASASDSVTVFPAPSITTTSLPNGNVEVPYSQQLTATGGQGMLTWSLATGSSLPGGLGLSSQGVVSGTPTATGTTNFTVQVTDQATTPVTASANLSITINPNGFQIVTTQLPSVAVGVAYATQLQSAGGLNPVRWAITSGSLPNGLSLNDATGLISGTPTVSNTFPFSVMATDSHNPPYTATANLSIQINPPTILPLELPVGTTTIPYFTQLFFTGATPPITWSIVPHTGNLPMGLTLNSSTGVISGTPPTGSQTNAFFEVQAVDSSVPPLTATQEESITITALNADNALLSGTYAFGLTGYDYANGGEASWVGIFTADGNGNITSGEADFNAPALAGSANMTFTGTYSLNSDNRGFMTLTTTDSNIPTVTFAFSAGDISTTSASGTMVEFDRGGGIGYVTSGTFLQQAAGPSLHAPGGLGYNDGSFSGNYVFGLQGSAPGGGNFSTAGVVTSDGNGHITGGMQDVNDAGDVIAQISIQGSYSVASNGRATMHLVTQNFSEDYVFYLADDSDAFVLSSDSGATAPVSGGPMTLQTGSAFDNTSLNGVSVLASTTSVPATLGADLVAGLFTADGNGNVTLSADENDAGNILPQTVTTGTYSVSSNGRVQVTGVANSPVLYLIDQNDGFLVGTDGGSAYGMLAAQQTATFTPGFYNGVGLAPEFPGASLYSGIANLTGTGSQGSILSADDSNASGTIFYGASNQRGYSIDSTGRGMVVSGQLTSIMYVVSSDEFVLISTYPLDVNSVLQDFTAQSLSGARHQMSKKGKSLHTTNYAATNR